MFLSSPPFPPRVYHKCEVYKKYFLRSKNLADHGWIKLQGEALTECLRSLACFQSLIKYSHRFLLELSFS